MTAIIHFGTFVLTGILLNLTPGNDTIFILSKSIGQGRKAGIVSAVGIGTGSLVHTLLAALGLWVLIAKSILLFNIITYAGAAYLCYIGYKMLTDKSGFDTSLSNETKAISYAQIYKDAIITNVLNPKVALFFIAFLPQFIDPSAVHTLLPFLLLGLTFITTGTIWCLVLATSASAVSARLKSNQSIAGYINKACGLTLIGLGIKVACTRKG